MTLPRKLLEIERKKGPEAIQQHIYSQSPKWASRLSHGQIIKCGELSMEQDLLDLLISLIGYYHTTPHHATPHIIAS